MSRAKYWWYDYVKKAIIHNLGDGIAPATPQEQISDRAVKKVLAETKSRDSGAERLKLIELVYKKRQYTVPGAAVQLHISETVAYGWSKDFVYTVAKEMGFW